MIQVQTLRAHLLKRTPGVYTNMNAKRGRYSGVGARKVQKEIIR